MWAGCLVDYGINTTNGCEIFHRHFGAGSLSPHPNMFDWLAHLHASHRRHLIKANGAHPISKKAHNLHLHLKNLEKRFRDNDIDATTFVKMCSLNCLPTSRIMGKTRAKRMVASIKTKYAKIVKDILSR